MLYLKSIYYNSKSSNGKVTETIYDLLKQISSSFIDMIRLLN